MPRSERARSKPQARGMTLVELMVATTVGLFVLAATSQWLLRAMATQRHTTGSTQAAQQLRAAADIMLRDLRRAGHWQQAWRGVGLAPLANVYQGLEPTPAQGLTSNISYAYSRDEGAEDNRVSSSGGRNERFGFDLVDGVLRTRVGGSYQALTDPHSVTVTALTLSPVVVTLQLGAACANPLRAACCRPHPSQATHCMPDRVEITPAGMEPSGSVAPPPGTVVHANCPVLIQRRVDLLLQGQVPTLPPGAPVPRVVGNARADTQHSIQGSVSPRNDDLQVGVCP